MLRLLLVDEEIPNDDWDDSTGSETPYMWYYAEAAKTDEDLKVTVVRSYLDARKLLDVSQIEFDVVSLDVSMPFPGGEGSEKAKSGLLTGLVLLDLIIERKHSVPVILLSNIPRPLLMKELPSHENYFNLTVFEKVETDPFLFVELVKELGRIG